MSSALQFSRRVREKEFILVWPGDDVVELKFLGETICAPPRDVVAEANKGRFRFGSAKDAQGRPIPGTVLLTDKYDQTDEGSIKSFNAEFFLLGDNTPGKGLLGVNEALVARGLMLVDDASQVEEARNLGRPMWEEAQAKADNELLANEFMRRQKHSEKFPGVPVPVAMDDAAIRQAVERQKFRTAKTSTVSNDDLLLAMGGVVPQTSLPSIAAAAASVSLPVVAPTPVVAVKAEPTISDVADLLMEAADKGKIVLSKDEWKGLARRDASVMQDVRKKLEKAGALEG